LAVDLAAKRRFREARANAGGNLRNSDRRIELALGTIRKLN
jgi:hypothetical protein